MYDGSTEYPSEELKLKSLRITSLDDEEEDEDENDPPAPVNGVFEDDDLEEDDDEEELEEGAQPVSLGFLETPKYSWSLNRELFPSTAGGTPVCSKLDTPLKGFLDFYSVCFCFGKAKVLLMVEYGILGMAGSS